MPSFGCEPDHNVSSSMIYVYARTGNVDMALKLYDDAKNEKWPVRAVAFSALIKMYAVFKNLHPPSCAKESSTCIGPTAGQMTFLFSGFCLLLIGAAGIRPCNLAFGVDQFNPKTESGKKGINSFFNWYYFTFTFAQMISLSLIVYVQSSVSWAIGLGIPAALMLLAYVLFFMGDKFSSSRSICSSPDRSIRLCRMELRWFPSFVWLFLGFYWVTAGGQSLTRVSPQLYWLCITFLAFDVAIVVICVTAACLIGIAVCCFLPCILAILYAVTDQEGATKEEIDLLPKYKFRIIKELKKEGDAQESSRGVMTECDSGSASEHIIALEDAECCICLSAYDDEAELRELPCNHHFHCTCIDKWLLINATCPLCKFNILSTDNLQEV
ncbi:unnamed protein product [Vicia faba]|uniref:RING-type E3 ubiquitin transferase n=1 Tax=Vicia faba TaxID=3906 RepID=A0AAV0ZMS6_VICFA|nr:unnamed protein product [Vicia faba]CAI8599221.1 unnamed protein product [Vicia faba]